MAGTKKRTFKLKMVLMAVMLTATICLPACGNKEKKTDENAYNGTLVFQYGDDYVTKGEVYIYLRTICERYENQYGEDVWTTADNQSEGSMEEQVREEAVNEIVKVKTLVRQSDSFRVILTEEEEGELKEKSSEIFRGFTDEDALKMELDEDLIYKVLRETTIAQKVEEQLLMDNPVEVSDEEARMTTFYDMYFNCYSMDAKGNVVPFTEEEKSIQHENALSACSTLATATIDENKEAENIANLAEYYKLSEAGEYTLSPDEILNVYGEDVYNLLYSMDIGDYSTVVETEYGYHVFQMIALTDRKATKAKKETMTLERINDQLSENLSKWEKKIDPDFSYPESIDMDVYNSIEIKQQ